MAPQGAAACCSLLWLPQGPSYRVRTHPASRLPISLPSCLPIPCCLALQEQIEHLISEREAWIEEVQAQRAEASGTLIL